MNKTQMNYWVDLLIAFAFIFSATSGIIFLFPISGSTVLGISYSVWDQVHTWGSLLMVTGVLAHLVLHWKWIVAMTKKNFFSPAKSARPVPAVASGALVSRRRFLQAAGLGAVAVGAGAVGYKALFSKETAVATTTETDDTVVESESTSIPLTVISTQSTSTACPKGETYDPYPGKCHHYTDSNGDGYCDYSIPSAT
ncbi:MAG: DUF4405 domain-containing protein [Ardenticatenaceae bacterium]|nr:DUF4405 domain-containing protein [Ardenticatenaceae bacterium]